MTENRTGREWSGDEWTGERVTLRMILLMEGETLPTLNYPAQFSIGRKRIIKSQCNKK